MADGCLDATTLALFVEHRLPAVAQAATEQHIDHCDACRGVVGVLIAGSPRERAGSQPTLAGAMIDRYLVIEELGAGAMGRVYLAADPELDRRVAIKLLRRRDGAAERDARLRREAQALAKVSHEHVAAIYDVGEIDGAMFLAMEYVGGGTLSRWLGERERSWREIVRVFRAAGRGLAAVHACGLVHRDFKPDNVLLDGAGNAKVTDFGLVAIAASETPASGLGAAEGVEVFGSLTTTGAVLGTPAYMAPEQFAGGAVDARTDQFSFCVALYEALYRKRPFAGQTVAELRAALAGPPAEPTPGPPRWLYRVIARGLATDPADRFPSIDALVVALSPERRTRRHAIAAAAAACIGVAAVIAWLATRSPAAGATCTTGELAYDPARVTAAFAHSRYAAVAATTVRATLDRYAAAWHAAHLAACETTQAPTTRDLRISCLDGRKRDLATFVDLLATGAPEVLEHAVDTAAALPPIAACDDVAALSGAPLPDDPGVRAQVAASRAARLSAEVLIDSGQVARAPAVIDAITATAARVGYAPLEIEALLLRGHLDEVRGELTHAATTFQRAAVAAERARDDRLRAWAWSKLIGALTAAGKIAEAEAQLPLAKAAVDRAGGDDDLTGLWETTQARVDYLHGKLAEANQLYDLALARARARKDRRGVGDLLEDRAIASIDTTDPTQTLAIVEEAHAIAVELYGADHPMAAHREQLIARVLVLQDKQPEALARLEHAYRTIVAAYGADHIAAADIEVTLGTTLRQLHRIDDSRAHLVHALGVMRAKLGENHFWVANALGSLALTERAAKQLPAALATAQQAHAIIEQLGPDTDGLIASYHRLAMLQRDENRSADAEASLRAGIAIGERIAPENPQLGLFYAELGSLRLEAQDPTGAETWLAKAVHQMAASSAKPMSLAWARLDLAHAKEALGKWPEVLDLATAARAALRDPPDLAEADALIAKAKHRLPK